MALSSDTASSSKSQPPSPSKDEQRNHKLKKRVTSCQEPRKLAGKKIDDIDSTRMSQQCGSSGLKEVKSLAMVQATKFMEGLPSKSERFVKPLLKSDVSNEYMLDLTECQSFFPEESNSITLVDANEKDYLSTYNSKRHCLDLGWRVFCQEHELVEGDVLVFIRTASLKFMVFIFQTAEAKGAIEVPSTLGGNSGHVEVKYAAMDRNTAISSFLHFTSMALSSDIASSSKSPPPSLSKDEKGNHKLTVKKRVTSLKEPMKLAGKKIDDIDNTRMLQQCGSSGLKEVKSLAMVQATEFKEALLSRFESFVKPLLKSDVSNEDWLDLTECQSFFPEESKSITLVDVVEKEYESTYERKSYGLTFGWSVFCKEHNLVEGDVLVFQRIERIEEVKYMVYIFQTAEAKGHVELKNAAMDRAKAFQKTLSSEYPSFVRNVLKSHVTLKYFLCLTISTCDSYLPKESECKITLVDVVGKEYETTYIRKRCGLALGWRVFCKEHNLVEGDALVFQRIEDLRYEVYIVKASQTAEANGAVSPLNLHSQAKTLETNGNNAGMIAGRATRRIKASDSEHVAEGTRLAKPILQFKDVDGLKSFSMIVFGSGIWANIELDKRNTYYRLCLSQNSFLHADLLEGVNSMLAAGSVLETVAIADLISPAKLTVSKKFLKSLDKRIMALEGLGMKVRFLRERLNEVLGLFYERLEAIAMDEDFEVTLEGTAADW